MVLSTRMEKKALWRNCFNLTVLDLNSPGVNFSFQEQTMSGHVSVQAGTGQVRLTSITKVDPHLELKWGGCAH